MSQKHSLLTPTLLTLAFFLVFGPWAAVSANAEPDSCRSICRESNGECHRAVRTDSRTCRSECKDSIRSAIATERETCDLQSLDEKECRERVVTAARAASAACLPDCREGHRHQKAECRQEARTCMSDCRGSVDLTCAKECRAEVKPCKKDLKTCRRACHQDRREAISDCRESTSSRSEFRECRSDVNADLRECSTNCGDSHVCREEARSCMETCQLDEDGA